MFALALHSLSCLSLDLRQSTRLTRWRFGLRVSTPPCFIFVALARWYLAGGVMPRVGSALELSIRPSPLLPTVALSCLSQLPLALRSYFQSAIDLLGSSYTLLVRLGFRMFLYCLFWTYAWEPYCRLVLPHSLECVAIVSSILTVVALLLLA